MAAPAAGGSPSFLQRKQLGLPVWAWALIVAGGAGAFILWTRMKGSSSAAATTAPVTTTTGSTGPGGFGVGGYGGSGTGGSGGTQPSPNWSTQPAQILPNGQPVYGAVPPPTSTSPSPTPSSPGNPSLPFQVQSGSGWWAGGSNWATDTPQQQQQATAAAQAAGPITDANGNEYEWLDSQEYNSMANSGVQVYYEILPGVFVPVPSNMASLAPGTPLYMQVPSGTSSNPSATPATAGA